MMRKPHSSKTRPLLIFLLGSLAYADTIIERVNFNLSDLRFEKSKGYDLVNLFDCELTLEFGAPQLPVKSIQLPLPAGAKVDQVKVINSDLTILANNYVIMPAQPPAILFRDFPVKTAEPNQAIYNALEPYPKEPLKFIGQGNFNGKNVAMILIYPLQFIPKLRQLRFFKEITILVSYQSKPKSGSPQSLNPSNGFEYLVITNSTLDTVFLRLCDWKTKKGVKATTREVNWIVTNYPGRDNSEKIRNYLKTLYADSGLVWLLLGGDVDIIPVRKAFAFPCSAFIHSREDSLPCDLYYADLDGTWDFNNNNVFGEVGDSVDLFPEIFVGRAPVNNIAQARAFVDKILTYERNPVLDYQRRALFTAEVLWSDPYTDAGVSKDWIDERYVPARFDPITKLYERLGNQNPNSVRSAINQGCGLINHNGHGWINVISVGTGVLYNSDMDNLINGQRQGVFYSIGCWTSAFDFDAIGEHFVRNPNGGGIAYIGNSSYGWGSPGNPRFGYSDRFDARFYAELFNNPAPHLGQVLALAKAYFVAHSRDANVYRWHQYQVNLLGEPEMMIATDSLKNLLVFHPNAIPFGQNRIVITVTDNGLPLKNALVCVKKGTEVYERGYTGFDGQISFNINPVTSGNLALTVTAPNFLPYETEIPTISGAYVTYLATAINDSLGNNDRIANPNETVGFSLLLKNEGNVGANDLIAKLTYVGSEVTIIDSLEFIGNLNPEESVWVNNGFAFSINNNVLNGTVVRFQLRITDNQLDTWVYQPAIIVGTPVIRLTNYSFTDSSPGGNNNGILEPGETVKLRVLIRNNGFGIGYETRANISSTDSNLTILNGHTNFGDILPDSLAGSLIPLEMRIEYSCPASYLIPIYTSIISDNYNFMDTILLLIGPTGLNEDFESGALGWTHSGINDRWHLSSHNYHSPNISFYCGDTNYHYLNNMNCYLLSPPFVNPPNSVLTFWRWFSLPIYGVDGLYVIIESNQGSDTLDFIGTGGALGENFSAIPGSWLPERYDLGSYAPGETLQIRFVFVSDNYDVSEGFYLDDVQVYSQTALAENLMVLPPKAIYLSPGYPNPFTNYTTIYYNLPYSAWLNINIYNQAGKLIRNLLNEPKSPGYYYLNWDGKDNNGCKLPFGVYFLLCKIKTNHRTTTLKRKLINLRK